LVPHLDPSASSVAVPRIIARDDCDNWLDQTHFAFIGCTVDDVNALFEVPKEVPDVPEVYEGVHDEFRSVHEAITSLLPSRGNESLIASVPCIFPCCVDPKEDFPAPRFTVNFLEMTQ
jgi:hypothetical protein